MWTRATEGQGAETGEEPGTYYGILRQDPIFILERAF